MIANAPQISLSFNFSYTGGSVEDTDLLRLPNPVRPTEDESDSKLEVKFLEIRRHGLVLVCFALLAPASSPLVLADAHPSALLALAFSPLVLTEARSAALLTSAPLATVFADARPTALLALAP